MMIMHNKPHSEATKQKLRELNLGKKLSLETRQKMSVAFRRGFEEGSRVAKKGQNSHFSRLTKERCPSWKGDWVGNDALHDWVRKENPPPQCCSFCNKEKKLDLANKEGIYDRNFKNWMWLCRKCHINYDIARRKKAGIKLSRKKRYD